MYRIIHSYTTCISKLLSKVIFAHIPLGRLINHIIARYTLDYGIWMGHTVHYRNIEFGSMARWRDGAMTMKRWCDDYETMVRQCDGEGAMRR